MAIQHRQYFLMYRLSHIHVHLVGVKIPKTYMKVLTIITITIIDDKAQKILKDIQDHFWKSGYVEFADPTSISYHKRIRNPEHLEGFQERFKKSLGSIELVRRRIVWCLCAVDTCTCHRHVQWNLTIVDTTGPRKCVPMHWRSVLISEVDLYTKSIQLGPQLIREVSKNFKYLVKSHTFKSSFLRDTIHLFSILNEGFKQFIPHIVQKTVLYFRGVL